jgi:hypothetical protein
VNIGRDRISFQPYVKQRSEATGSTTWAAKGDPVPFRANVHPLDMNELTDAEREAVLERVRVFFYGRTWPGERHGRYTYRGVEWDQVLGDAQHFTAGSQPHWEAVLERRGDPHG